MTAKALAKRQCGVNHEADTGALARPLDHQITMAKSAEWHLEKYRPLLFLQARQLHQNPVLFVRGNWSALVHETLLKAPRNLDGCKAPTEAARIQWLRKILITTAIEQGRHERAERR